MDTASNRQKAFVSFLIRNDNYLPGALAFAYGIRKQNIVADLICIVSENITLKAKKALNILYDDIIEMKEVFVRHKYCNNRQDCSYLFSRFNALLLGCDGPYKKSYKKIVIADSDILPLSHYRELFSLNTPAGIINERKENCIVSVNNRFIVPRSFRLKNEWKWHEIYNPICPHSSKIPKNITDRVMYDIDNMGVNSGLYVLAPSQKLYDNILSDLENDNILKLIERFRWPEMQYLTMKLSGSWHNIDIKYASFNGYPDISGVYGIHFAGLKPWCFNNKSVKHYSKYNDFKLWHSVYLSMLYEYKELFENKRLKKLFDNIITLRKSNKY